MNFLFRRYFVYLETIEFSFLQKGQTSLILVRQLPQISISQFRHLTIDDLRVLRSQQIVHSGSGCLLWDEDEELPFSCWKFCLIRHIRCL